MYRVRGQHRKQYFLPDIGMRATQGHSVRDDLGSGYLMARLSMDSEASLPHFVFMARTRLLGGV